MADEQILMSEIASANRTTPEPSAGPQIAQATTLAPPIDIAKARSSAYQMQSAQGEDIQKIAEQQEGQDLKTKLEAYQASGGDVVTADGQEKFLKQYAKNLSPRVAMKFADNVHKRRAAELQLKADAAIMSNETNKRESAKYDKIIQFMSGGLDEYDKTLASTKSEAEALKAFHTVNEDSFHIHNSLVLKGEPDFMSQEDFDHYKGLTPTHVKAMRDHAKWYQDELHQAADTKDKLSQSVQREALAKAALDKSELLKQGDISSIKARMNLPVTHEDYLTPDEGKKLLDMAMKGKAGGVGYAAADFITKENVNKHGEEFVSILPPSVLGTVKAIGDGRETFASLGIRGQERAEMVKLVNQYKPDYEMGKAPAKMAVQKDFSSGKTAANMTKINTAIGHIGSMASLAEAADTGDVQFANKLISLAKTQFGHPEVTNAELASIAIGDEMMNVFKQSGSSEMEAQAWREKFNAAVKSPSQMKGALKTAAELLGSRIDNVNEQWKRGMDTEENYPHILSERSKKTLDMLGIPYEKSKLEADLQVTPDVQKGRDATARSVKEKELAEQKSLLASNPNDTVAQRNIKELERESGIKSGKGTETHPELPDAKKYDGKIATDTQTNTKYKSINGKWVKQ